MKIINGDLPSHVFKKYLPGAVDLEHQVKLLIRLLKVCNHIKKATYQITNDYVIIDYDNKSVKVLL
jgi:hypothetical protein